MTAQVVDTTSEIIAKLQTLAPEQQQQVLDFVEFLMQKYGDILPAPPSGTARASR